MERLYCQHSHIYKSIAVAWQLIQMCIVHSSSDICDVFFELLQWPCIIHAIYCTGVKEKDMDKIVWYF